MSQPFISLMYHDVGDAAPAGLSPSVTSYFVDTATFRQQVAYLAEHADCVTLSQLEAMSAGDGSTATSRPRVQVTFDDGWRGSIDVAGPVLEAHGWQGLLFVTTGLIGAPDFADARTLRELPPDVMQVGAHGVTHRYLAELSMAEIREELATSKARLEEIVGREVTTVSIPGGATDSRVRRIAEEVGYRCLFTSRIGRNTHRTDPLDLCRVAIKTTTTCADFQRIAAGNISPEQRRQRLLALPKSILGPQRYRRARSMLLGEDAAQQDMADLLPEAAAKR